MYPYHHVRTEDGRESLTIFLPEGAPVVATADHPNFDALLAAAREDGPADEIRELDDLSHAAAQRFEALSERVSVAAGRVYFDGDEVDSAISRQIVRCLDEPDAGDWRPLVRFMENVAANPVEHSREQLFAWLRDRDFTITTDGCFIAYKGVSSDDEGNYVSGSRGHGIVNGEGHEGQLPNPLGATVEMPRADVQHDPSHGCSTGLHVGTYAYAQDYANAALLTVLVNPRDVVSVPTDCNAEKMRVCRYTVSDDEPTPPDKSPAIEYDETEPEGRTLYHAVWLEAETDYFAKTGEARYPAEGEFYLYREGTDREQVGRAYADYDETLWPSDMVAPAILEPTKPQLGDYIQDAEGGKFYCAGHNVWLNARDYADYGDFVNVHSNCIANDKLI